MKVFRSLATLFVVGAAVAFAQEPVILSLAEARGVQERAGRGAERRG